jgi:gliding motility-associated-like protein
MTYTSADLTVNKATLSVIADSKEKVYGSANPALTFHYDGFVPGEDESVLDIKPQAATSITVSSDAGLHAEAITVAGGTDNNYQFIYAPADFNITKAVLTATADNKIKVYGETNPGLTFTYSGFVNGDDSNDIDVAPSIMTDAVTASPTGVYPVILALGNDNNYVINRTDGSLTVTKAALTATADNKSKTYSEANPELTVSYTGFVNGDDASSLDVAPVPSTGATVSSGAGSYPVTLSSGSDNNYEITNIEGTLTINRAVLKVTADDKSKVYGQPNPELTLSYSGFVNGDDLSVIDSKPSVFTSAGPASDAGSYGITADGGSDNNYSFTYQNGSFVIVKADQTISFQPVTADLRATQSEELKAASTSGLPVSFESSHSDIAEINGNIMSVLREGTVTITAYQDGNHNYNPAITVVQTIETLPTFDNLRSLFTPNNDGMNDYWYIPDIEQYGTVHVQVYNRFGKLVYESSAYKNDWDGTFNGRPLPEASYYYILKSSEKDMIIKGVVNIVR